MRSTSLAFVLLFLEFIHLVSSQSTPTPTFAPTLANGGGGGSSDCGYDYQPVAITLIVTSGLFLSTTIIGAALIMAGAGSTALYRFVGRPTKLKGSGINESTETDADTMLGAAAAGALGMLGLAPEANGTQDTGTGPASGPEETKDGIV
jgi:hypothetical protein